MAQGLLYSYQMSNIKYSVPAYSRVAINDESQKIGLERHAVTSSAKWPAAQIPSQENSQAAVVHEATKSAAMSDVSKSNIPPASMHSPAAQIPSQENSQAAVVHEATKSAAMSAVSKSNIPPASMHSPAAQIPSQENSQAAVLKNMKQPIMNQQTMTNPQPSPIVPVKPVIANPSHGIPLHVLAEAVRAAQHARLHMLKVENISAHISAADISPRIASVIQPQRGVAVPER